MPGLGHTATKLLEIQARLEMPSPVTGQGPGIYSLDVGAIAAAFLTGGVLSLGSLVGLVTVIGIAARNGIMLVSHYRHMQTEEGVPFGRDLVLRGAEERLAPILMTALATGLALVPIALSGDKAGHEIEHPMAVVILGGLVTSTLLNLFLLPPLYLRFGRQEAVTNEDQLSR